MKRLNDQPEILRHKTRRGISLPIGGAPKQLVDSGHPVTQVAVTAVDFRGIRPRMVVQEGDRVKRGTPLFEDRKKHGLRFTSPGAGTVVAVERGARRALLSVVIALDEAEIRGGDAPAETFNAYESRTVETLSPEALKALLLESGLFPLIRRRPFDKIPSPDEIPESIFVSACPAHPLAPDPAVALDGAQQAFETGLVALSKLAKRKVVVVLGQSVDIALPDHPDIEGHRFIGPFPFGTVGSAMHRIDPPDRNRPMWHIDYQSVAAIGHLVATGELKVSRVIALAGPGVTSPRLLRTRMGAAIGQLTDGGLGAGDYRVLSGSVFSGRMSDQGPLDYLGYYHDQITVLDNADERRFLGWLSPGANRFSVSRLFVSGLLRRKALRITTDQQGGERVMVPVGLLEKVWPLDLLVTPLLRALLAEDDEMAESLGCLELSEEDVAACSFVCPSKIDYGEALRRTLNRIEEQG